MSEEDPKKETGTVMIGVKKAASILGVSPRTVWRMIADEQIKVVRFRHCTRLALAEVMAMIHPTGKANNV
jgi:excisionase family DNA binding protein